LWHAHWIAAPAALFLWWFATGILLWRVHRADRGDADQHLNSVLYSLPLLVLGGYGVAHSLGDTGRFGVWVAFLSAMMIWAWAELAFLSGVITGPNKAPCPQGLDGQGRFRAAFLAVAWHELLLALALGVLAYVSRGAENSFAFWTFAVLFAARISAKLNLFLGVPRINVHFLPKPISHLASYFRTGPITAFFPVSVTLLALGLGCFLERLMAAHSAQTQGALLGFLLLSILTALALLEHWFMVWRFRDDRLWSWLIGPAARRRAHTVETTITKRTEHGL